MVLFWAWVVILDWGSRICLDIQETLFNVLVTAVASSYHLFYYFEVGHAETQGQGLLQTTRCKPRDMQVKGMCSTSLSMSCKKTCWLKCLRAFPPCPYFALCNFAYNESLMKNYLTWIRWALLGQICFLLLDYNVKGSLLEVEIEPGSQGPWVHINYQSVPAYLVLTICWTVLGREG